MNGKKGEVSIDRVFIEDKECEKRSKTAYLLTYLSQIKTITNDFFYLVVISAF